MRLLIFIIIIIIIIIISSSNVDFSKRYKKIVEAIVEWNAYWEIWENFRIFPYLCALFEFIRT